MVKEHRMRVRMVLATVLCLSLGVYSTYEVLENSDVNVLDSLLPGGRTKHRVDRAAEKATDAEQTTIHASPTEAITAPITTSTADSADKVTTPVDSVTTTASKSETEENEKKDEKEQPKQKKSTESEKGTETPETSESEQDSSTTTPETVQNEDVITTASVNATTAPPATTTTTKPLPCDEKPFPLSQVCNLTVIQQQGYLGGGVVLEELADTFFNTVVLDGLATKCENGTWCLGYNLDKDLLLGDSQVYMQYCELLGCLGTIPAECMTRERELVLSTLRLLCNARMLNVTDKCFLGIKKMTHVALVDEVVSVNETGPNCSISKSGDCTPGCLVLGQQLTCMWNACYGQMELSTFTDYGQWRWALHEELGNNSDVCNRNNTQCPGFSDSPVLELKIFQQMLYKIQQNGPAVLAGVITALVVTVAGFGIIFWACAKKVYVFYEYSRDRVEYTEVKDSTITTEEDSDDEEDILHPA